jgi:Holliday junction resolvasome RuvABC endonuclease subunit
VLWELEEVINLHKPDMVLREEVVGSKSAKASRILNMLKGGIIGVCVGRRISYQSVAARRTKEFVAGKADASKEEMVNAVSQYFPEIMSIKPKYKQEAIADACALYITLRKEDWK